MLWLLYGSATAPLRGNCLPCPIGCQTDQPHLGCRGEKEAVPWPWDVLSTPAPWRKQRRGVRGKGGMKTFYPRLSHVLAGQTLPVLVEGYANTFPNENEVQKSVSMGS